MSSDQLPIEDQLWQANRHKALSLAIDLFGPAGNKDWDLGRILSAAERIFEYFELPDAEARPSKPQPTWVLTPCDVSQNVARTAAD